MVLVLRDVFVSRRTMGIMGSLLDYDFFQCYSDYRNSRKKE